MKKEVLIISILLSCSIYAEEVDIINFLREESKKTSLENAIERVQVEILSNSDSLNKFIQTVQDDRLELEEEDRNIFNKLLTEDFIEVLESESSTETGDRPCGVIKP